MNKFIEAIYREDNVSRRIALEDISLEKNYVVVIQHLFCPGDNCPARLVFNTRSNGDVYLSKHIGDTHDSMCPYFAESGIVKKPETVYLEENGNLSTDGISRRKKLVDQELQDYLTPKLHKEKRKVEIKPRAKQVIDKQKKQTIVKVKYDPNASVIDKTEEDRGVREPAFFGRLPQQVSRNDQNKNLRTAALLEEIVVDQSAEQAKIVGSLEGTQVTFILPQSFFRSDRRSVTSSQLLSFLTLVRDFINEKDHAALYIATLCQSQLIDLDDIHLYIFDPTFPTFRTMKNTYDSLDTLAAAISTRAIK